MFHTTGSETAGIHPRNSRKSEARLALRGSIGEKQRCHPQQREKEVVSTAASRRTRCPAKDSAHAAGSRRRFSVLQRFVRIHAAAAVATRAQRPQQADNKPGEAWSRRTWSAASTQTVSQMRQMPGMQVALAHEDAEMASNTCCESDARFDGGTSGFTTSSMYVSFSIASAQMLEGELQGEEACGAAPTELMLSAQVLSDMQQRLTHKQQRRLTQ